MNLTTKWKLFQSNVNHDSPLQLSPTSLLSLQSPAGRRQSRHQAVLLSPERRQPKIFWVTCSDTIQWRFRKFGEQKKKPNKTTRLVVLSVFKYGREQETKTWMVPGCKNLVGQWTLTDRWAVILEKPVAGLKSTFAHSTVTPSWSALMLILMCIQPATCCSHGFIRWAESIQSTIMA